jgi:hypothetical protein
VDHACAVEIRKCPNDSESDNRLTCLAPFTRRIAPAFLFQDVLEGCRRRKTIHKMLSAAWPNGRGRLIAGWSKEARISTSLMNSYRELGYISASLEQRRSRPLPVRCFVTAAKFAEEMRLKGLGSQITGRSSG